MLGIAIIIGGLEMKKLLSTFVICGALLAACSNDEKADLKKEDEVAKTEQVSTEQPATTDASTEEEFKITQEEAKKVVDNLVETAKKDALVDDVIIEEKDEQVNVEIKFPEGISDQERGKFLFNYMLFVEKQYPEKEIKYSVDE